MDQKFTERLQSWLQQPDVERDYEEGALLLLKLNGNPIMYRNLMANPKGKADFIVYNLQKYLNFRVQQLTHEQVQEMQVQADRIVQEHVGLKEQNPAENFQKGKRQDHEDLPDEIQALYVENLSIVQRMREVHLRLRSLSLVDAPCPDSERYPFLKELIELDKRLHENWKVYDHFVPGGGEPRLVEDVRERSKAALRIVNLSKGRYKKNPSPELKDRILEQYALILNPSEKLVEELTELKILE